MSHVLITGGAGFIGSCLVRQLLAAGTELVVTLDKLTYAGNLDSLAEALHDPRHVFVQGDICDGDLVRQLLEHHQIDRVAHLAAESHVDRSIDGPQPFIQTNVVGTCQLLEAARRYWSEAAEPLRSRFRFLHVSTDEVYGSLGATALSSKRLRTSPARPIRRRRPRPIISPGPISTRTGCRS